MGVECLNAFIEVIEPEMRRAIVAQLFEQCGLLIKGPLLAVVGVHAEREKILNSIGGEGGPQKSENCREGNQGSPTAPSTFPQARSRAATHRGA